MPHDIKNSATDCIKNELISSKQISVSIIRFDQLHPVVSGNKLFKLYYFLQNYQAGSTLVTFGGAYSNHLVATAFACKEKNIPCIGFVRGEKPASLSKTLIECINYGMQLKFLDRALYNNKETECFINELKNAYGQNIMIVPEGGYHPMGAKGASLMMNAVSQDATHICCASGTATTFAGLLLKKQSHQQVVAIPVLKGMHDFEKRLQYLTGRTFGGTDLFIADAYHFGGYAKKTPQLLAFMNQLYQDFNIPTDFVYTGKMMFAVMDLIEKDFFPAGSNIVCVHTGGLQGNNSLPENTLTF